MCVHRSARTAAHSDHHEHSDNDDQDHQSHVDVLLIADVVLVASRSNRGYHLRAGAADGRRTGTDKLSAEMGDGRRSVGRLTWCRFVVAASTLSTVLFIG